MNLTEMSMEELQEKYEQLSKRRKTHLSAQVDGTMNDIIAEVKQRREERIEEDRSEVDGTPPHQRRPVDVEGDTVDLNDFDHWGEV